MRNLTGLLLNELGSLLEYEIDRGETSISEVKPACRYLKPKPLDKLVVTTADGTFEITAKKIG